MVIFLVLTDVNTSCVSWIVAIRFHLNFLNSLTLVGLCSVAEGCVRKNVGNRFLLDSAGELEPYPSCKKKNSYNYETILAILSITIRLYYITISLHFISHHNCQSCKIKFVEFWNSENSDKIFYQYSIIIKNDRNSEYTISLAVLYCFIPNPPNLSLCHSSIVVGFSNIVTHNRQNIVHVFGIIPHVCHCFWDLFGMH